MPRTPTTPAQISGHQFLLRRVQLALVRSDSRMLHDPLRTRMRALLVSLVAVVLLLAGAAIVSLIRPGVMATGQGDVLLVAETGALHVRVNERLHPVSNIASARLIVGSAVEPQRVRESVLSREQIGFPVGIEGAPSVPGSAARVTPAGQPNEDTPAVELAVCEESTTEIGHTAKVRQTVVRVGDVGAAESSADAVLASYQGRVWLISDGVRAEVTAGDPVVARALRLERARLRPVGPALLRAVPEVAALTVPAIPGRGEPSGFAAPFDRIGSVVEVGSRRVVVLADGAAEVSPVLAEMLAAKGGLALAEEAQLAAIPVAVAPEVAGLPAQPPEFVSDNGWLCAGRVAAEGDTARVRWMEQRPRGRHVEYPNSDGAGVEVDGFIDGRADAGASLSVSSGGGVHVISPEGVRFQVKDRTALHALGFAGAVEVQWSTLVALRAGPQLSREAALMATGSAPRVESAPVTIAVPPRPDSAVPPRPDSAVPPRPDAAGEPGGMAAPDASGLAPGEP